MSANQEGLTESIPSTRPSSSQLKSQTESQPQIPRVSVKVVDATKGTSDSALVKSQLESNVEPFSDDCERYQKDCCCCHCVAVRCAIKRAAFLRTPEGKRRLEMKMHMKSFFMDMNAMTYARRRIENQLDDSKDSMPSPLDGYPASITKVQRIAAKCLSVDWFVHDLEHVDHYEIFVDNRRHKSVFNPQLNCTILLDVNAKNPHRIIMKAFPTKGSGSKQNPMDQLISDLCSGGMNKVLNGDYFCKCGKETEMQKIERTYKDKKCRTPVDFWHPSEFLYTPVCSCRNNNCDCD